VKVYEDARTLAFMDVMPQADGHVLVVPKEEAEKTCSTFRRQARPR